MNYCMRDALAVTWFAAAVIATSGLAQAPVRPSNDPFVGKWALNASKSTLPPADSTVTIESDGKKYKITLYFKDGTHGWKYTSSTVTSMNGKPSTVTRSFSKSQDEWRVTREGQNTFIIESFFHVDQYTVSADGKILTNRLLKSRLTTYDENPIPGSVKTVKTIYPVLVYEKTHE